MATYRVDSYHIALQVVGDSAIHLLVQENQPSDTVAWAMLVDGGSGAGHLQIQSTIQWIQNSGKYSINNTTTPLRFDAVIISHWDSDHYDGVINLIKADLDAQGGGDVTNRMVSFFYYDKTHNPRVPKTILYCPAAGYPAKGGKRFTASAKANTNPAKTSTNFVYDNKQCNEICQIRIEPLSAGAATLIGLNLLTETPIAPAVKVGSPTDLVMENIPSPGQPGIYILAASTRTIVSKSATLTSNLRFPGGVGVVDESKKGTPTNTSSIACMIIWPRPGELARLSHYFAGDMYWDLEDQLRIWTGTSGDRDKVGHYVKSMKLSHHGSKTSTSTMMIKMFNPSNLIASVAERNGHPSWELMLFLEGWLRTGDANKAASKPLLTTQFPYYLVKWRNENVVPPTEDWIPLPKGPSNQMSMTVLTKPNQDSQKYLDRLQMEFNLAAQAMMNFQLNSPQVDYKNALQQTPNLDARDWVRTRISVAWPTLSSTPVEWHAGVGVVRTGANWKTDHAAKMPQFFLVVSSNDDSIDGSVYRQMNDGTPLKQIKPDPQNVPPNPNGTIVTPNRPLFTGPNNGWSTATQQAGPPKRSYFPRYHARLVKKRRLNNLNVSPLYSPAGGTNPNENDELLESLSASDAEDEPSDGGPMFPLPVPGLPQTPSPGSSELQPPYYFVCASNMNFLGTIPASVKQLTASDALNNFLSVFHLKGIVLSDVPKLKDSLNLHSQDEFSSWLSLALAPPSPSQVTGTVPVSFSVSIDEQDPSYFTSFQLTIPALGGSQVYASGSTAAQLQIPQSLLGPASTVPVQNSFILGLETPAKSQGLYLSDILQPAVDRNASLLYLQIFGLIIGKTATFHIDDSNDSKNPTRNAIWFDPIASYYTMIRTQYVADASLLETINTWISKAFSEFKISTLTLVTKLGSTWATTSTSISALNSWEVMIQAQCTVGSSTSPLAQPLVIFDFQSSMLTITIQFDSASLTLDSMIQWITNQISGADFNFTSWFRSDCFSSPILRRLILSVGLDSKGNFPKSIDGFSVDLEVGLLFGKSTIDPVDVVFLFTYQWSRSAGSSLQGSLWCPPPSAPDVDRRLLPDYEPSLAFEPVTPSPGAPWAASLDLANLVPQASDQVINIPDGIPTEIIMASLKLNASQISFSGKIECQEPTSGKIPTVFLSRIALDATYTFASKSFVLGFQFGVSLFPPAKSLLPPIEISGDVEYNSGSWKLSADVETPGMQGAHLANYFDADTKADATALIQHIQLLYLKLTYSYDNTPGKSNGGSSFTFGGDLLIGSVELTLDFNYDSTTGWKFVATLSAFGEQCTLQDMLDSIIGDGTVDLPDCVGQIALGGSGASVKGSTVILTLESLKSNSSSTPNKKDIVTTLVVDTGQVAFTFLQYRNTRWDVGTNPSKRFLQLAVHNLPEFTMPVVGDLNLSATIQEVYLMWVQDGSKTNVEQQPAGFTKAEVTNLNSGVLKDSPIYYKLPKVEDTYGDTDVWVEAGFHFVIVASNKGTPEVVMDYVFGKPSSTSKTIPAPTQALRNHAKCKRMHGPDAFIQTRKTRMSPTSDLENVADDPANAGGGTQKTAFKVSIGPISISNVGVRFSNSVLTICLDASVAIGPIAMALMGFGVDFDFGNGHNLQTNFPDPSPTLQGLVVDFDRPPLVIGGGLVQQPTTTPGDFYYAGGVTVGFKMWTFLAAGAYGQLTDPKTSKKYTTAFLFASLKGPLLTLQYATISGLAGGFGYNNNLTLPTVAEVPSFPFLKVPTPAPPSSTMDMLKALINSKWFMHQHGSFWVAAGLTVTAFQMLQVTAVVVVQWDPSITAGIYAVAVADMPSTDAPFKVAHVELGILATIDFGKGIAAFEGQLAPSSFILDSSCKLTGGFALYYWFKGDSPDGSGDGGAPGDWVFSLGGYHPSYTKPPQYPNCPRLQIQWSLGPLSITGQAYFAITPNVCMAGASLHASLTKGVLGAWLDAFADFIINYKPFSFTATGGVSVGVRYNLDLLFVTLHINIEISATVTILGPPFHGSVYVDFWVFGFTINFGNETKPTIKAATLPDFYHLALQQGGPTQTTIPVPHLFQCISGLLPDAPAPAKSPRQAAEVQVAQDAASVVQGDASASIWEVHAGTFVFSVSSVFAISDVVVNPPTGGQVTYTAPAPPNTVPIYSRPMYLTSTGTNTAIQSTLTVDIQRSSTVTVEDVPTGPWTVEPIIQQVPRALWDAYDAETDPNNGSKSLLGTGQSPTLPLMMGIRLTPPAPSLSEDEIQPFDAVLSQLSDVFPTPPNFPNSTAGANSAWAPQYTPPPKPDPDPAAPWAKVQALWETPAIAANAAQQTTAAWGKCMGWKVADVSEPGAITGAIPAALILNLQTLYVAAPMVAQRAPKVAAAA